MNDAHRRSMRSRPTFQALEPRLLLDAVKEPYLQAVMSDSMYVLLEADSQAAAVVDYGLTASYGLTATTESAEITEGSYQVHNIKLTGLAPNTQYHYQVAQGNTTSEDYTFWTAAEAGMPFRFAWMADPRSNPSVHGMIAGLIDGYDPKFSLYGGDLCASASRSSWNTEFFVPNEQALIAQVPFFNAVGNHEGFNALARAFTQGPDAAGETNGYYSLDYGDLHVLVLNTEIDYTSGSAQWNFALSDLSASTARWKIVTAHKPAYSSSREDLAMQAMTTGIFEPNGVDMVLAGHDHYYEHNLVNGIHHMVIGSAGAPLYNPTEADYTVFSAQEYNFAIFDMTPNALHMVAYNEQGSVLETIDLVKDDTPPTAPTGLLATAVSDAQIDLTWTAATDDESGIDHYNIYRGGVVIGTSTGTSYSDTGLSGGTSYTYEVSAVNGDMAEGEKSNQAGATTLADTTAPTLDSVLATSQTTVAVVFSEPVGQTSAELVTNYAIDQGVFVSSAALQGDTQTVVLTVSPLSQGVTYTLTVNNVTDSASTPNPIAENTQQTFQYVVEQTVTVVQTGSNWKYLVTPSEPSDQESDTWRDPGFDDASWPEDPAQLGFGGNGEDTTIGYGPDPSNKYTTTYFRHSFEISEASNYTDLDLGLLRDDGGVVYLNGQEALRSNMPGGEISWSTFSSSIVGGTDENTFFPYTIDPGLLVEGANLLAVEIHQCNLGSSDLGFDLELKGTRLSGPDTTPPTLDSVSATTETQVAVVYSERVEQSTAQTFGNYSIDNGVTIFAAALEPDGKTVLLTTSTLIQGVPYTLTVNNVEDLAGNPIAATEQTFEYIAEQTLTFQQGTGSYTDAADTNLFEDPARSDTSYATATLLNVDADEPSTSGNDAQALVRFDNIFGSSPGQVSPNATIIAATLELAMTNGGNSIALHRMLRSWSDTDTWNGLGSGVQTDGVEAAAVPDASTGSIPIATLSIDVTASLTAWRADPSGNYGWAIVSAGSDGVDFHSAEGAVPPRLVVDVIQSGSPAPAAPIGLAAASEPDQISLDWDDNTEPELAGYNVYRSLTPGGPYDLLRDVAGTGTQLLQTAPISASTEAKPQSKVWQYDNTWWSVLPDPGGTWLWRLDGTTWTQVLLLSGKTTVKADCKPDGNVTHILLYDGLQTQLASVEFVPGLPSTYQWWSARPGLSDVTLSSGVETATLDVDSAGRMWVASDAATDIEVRYSDSPYDTWSGPLVLASGVSTDDISVVSALPDGTVGVLWSNQITQRFGFRVHVDGAGPAVWSADEVPASQSALAVGGGMADDHLNVAVASDGTLYAAVKTSYDTAGYPKIALLVRRPSGTWDNLYGLDESGTRPIVVLNEALASVSVVYTSSEGLNDIVLRESSTAAIAFGNSQTLLLGGLNNASSTKQNCANELVVLASSSSAAAGVRMAFSPGADPLSSEFVDTTVALGQTYYYVVTAEDTFARESGFSNEAAATPAAGVPVATDDAYNVNEDNTLTVPEPGVLGNDSDPEAEPLTAILVSDVSNGSLSLNGDGSFDYTPDPDFNGSDSFSYKANDGSNDSSLATVTITIDPVNDAPAADGQSVATDEDTPAAITLTGSDVDGDPLTYIVVSGPSNGSLSGTAPNLTYTPDANYNGPDSFTFKANDGAADSNIAAVTVTVNPANDDPSFTSTAVTAATEDAAYSYSVTAADPDVGDTLTITAPTLPGWLTLTDHGDGTATLSGTPLNAHVGDNAVTLRVTDLASAYADQSFTITVANTNDEPTVDNPVADVTVDEDADDTVLDLSGVFADLDPGDSLTLSVTGNTNPALVTTNLVATDLTLSYVADQSGAADITVRGTDLSGAFVENTFAVTVNPVNDAPVAVDDDYDADQDATLNVDAADGVLANDTDVEGDLLSAILVGGVSNGSLGLNPDGSFAYTPNAGYVGPDSFTYKAHDGTADSNVATVTITVNAGESTFYATGESFTSGTVSGSHLDTQESDNIYEALTEVVERKKSILEHTWTFELTGGEAITFSVEAYHSPSTEDDFKFQYSTNGAVWTDMVTVTKTGDDDTAQTYDLPAGLSGTVSVRAIDTNRAAQKTELDTLYVDEMYIVSQGAGPQLPTLTVEATDASAAEEGQETGTFTITRSDTSGDLTVYYGLSGTAANGPDYSMLAAMVVIPDGASSVEVVVAPINDDLEEGSETAILTIDPDAGYNVGSPDSDTVTIIDNDVTATDDHAVSESTAFGTVTRGDYTSTSSSDDTYEEITEQLRGNTSLLEHTWTFDVTGGNSVTFHVEAYRSGTEAEDDFLFQYSTDGLTWTDMLTVTKTDDDDTAQTYDLPAGLSATVYVRAIDTNRARKTTTLDTLYIDEMFFHCE